MQLLIFAIALGWGLTGCVERFSHPDRVETVRSHLTDAEYAAELMTDLPVWVRTNEFSGYSTGLFTASDVAAYAYAASELAGMSKADVRAGLLLAQAEAYDEGFVEGVAFELNTFVLWRVLFDIPAQAKTAQIGWWGPHAGHAPYHTWQVDGVEYYNYQWPAVFDATGALTGIEPFGGGRGGYTSTVDFDQLAGLYDFR
ncbi:MAG: hypothetical protein KC549_11630 [Myxococcales bacterium]|nr:hypothetical protein [Myxococcales bacterium]MCB9546290.1 hypothetical protein [Myxococcales bacterium]